MFSNKRFISGAISPPARVEILRTDDSSLRAYWKPGQFGYAKSYTTHPNMHTIDRGSTEPHELVFLVSKSKDGGGGGLWFSADALRFTRPPTELKTLTDEERVALDHLLEGGDGGQLEQLVPDIERRDRLPALAARIRSLRGR